MFILVIDMFFCPESLQEVCNYSASSLILLLLWKNVGSHGGIGRVRKGETPFPQHLFTPSFPEWNRYMEWVVGFFLTNSVSRAIWIILITPETH